jgi:CheY-like chemotaxis protein
LRLADLHDYVERTFRHVAESKNVGFFIKRTPDLYPSLFTDAKRLQQVLKNLLSNAFKFTHRGQVTLVVEPAQSGWSPENESLNRAPGVIAFTVSDTGIGIPPDKQQIIFEAFQQADGSTSRKYGGTGLGLAISRELSRLLGGEIRLRSIPGTGSTFTLYLPQTWTPRAVRKTSVAIEPLPPAVERSLPLLQTNGIRTVIERSDRSLALQESPPELPASQVANEWGDDRESLRPGDQALLIVENDPGFARFLLDAARENGFKGLVTSFGAGALALAREYPLAALTLDILLPDMEGWRVLERLKNDLHTRHIPVCVISTEEARERAFDSGALAFVSKPVKTREVLDQLLREIKDFNSPPPPRLVIVEPNDARRDHIRTALRPADLPLTEVADDSEALSLVHNPTKEGRVGCLVLGPGLPTERRIAVANELRGAGPIVPAIIVYEAEGVMEDRGWKQLSRACTARRVHSVERLLDDAVFFLHGNVAKLPEAARGMLENLHRSDRVLPGKKVLIVDDDMRNIFALSTVLEEHGMLIAAADNGRDAIQILKTRQDIDIVLMDIMMPEMDGIDTMREIRKIPHLGSLPIIAVTAKAMKGDREKCIEAGAWDYLSKPVETEQMLAVLRAWLHR